jgi:lysophospholipid acyltransferase (LPLAT)-like uncharacterized protein
VTSPRTWLGGRALHLYSQITRATARYQLLNKETLDALDGAGRPAIWTSWHGATMMIAGYFFRHRAEAISDMLIIIPDDWRGETLAEWIRIAGASSFAVSMEEESLVAARRFLQLIRLVREGKSVYMTPDGPDGPSGVPKPGISFLAAKSGAAVLPVGVYTPTRYQLRRWDRYSLPLPYSRITIFFGEPLTVTRHEDVDAAGKRITAAINRAMAEAQARY